MTRGPARKAFSKRDMKWVGVTVDEYTNELMERAILLGKAESRVQAINKGLCLLLEIPYKTDEQVLAERQAEYMRLAIEAANPKTQQELDDEVLKKAEEIRLKREQQSQPQVMTPELMEELNKAAALADTKRAEIMSERERRRIQAEQKQVEESNGTNR